MPLPATTEAPAEAEAPEVEIPVVESEQTVPAEDLAKALADAQAEAEKWKGLSRQHEARSKTNADAAEKLAQLEEANKSEAERLQDRLDKAEARANEAQAELVRFKVAARHGLTEDQTRRLIGVTEEELEADAVELLKSLTPPKVEEEDDDEPTPSTTPTPRPKLKSGATGPSALNDDALTADLKRKLGVR